MLFNYIKVILRSLRKNKIYTLINITGLTTGIVVFSLIMLYVKYEFSVDQYHKKKDRIYRIAQQQVGNMYLGDDRFAVTMAPLAPAVKEEFPEVESATRIAPRWNILIKTEEKSFIEPIIYGIDPDAFGMFTFDYLDGNPDLYLNHKYSAILSESAAKKYYGEMNPVGRTFLYEDEFIFEVAGVIKDMPVNSHFRMDILLPFETLLEVTGRAEDLKRWDNSSYYTYILLKENCDPKVLESKFPTLLEKYSPNQDSDDKISTNLFLQNLSVIYLYSDIHFDIGPTVNVMKLYVYMTIAFLILIIACINYMNLATARASLRAREVGIRKVVGASRHNLIWQFLGESLALTFLSLLFSMMIISVMLPYFEAFIERDLYGFFIQGSTLLLLIGGVCGFVGIVSGSYPAFALSAFKPVLVLKGSTISSITGSKFRNILVIVQFAISSSLIIATLIVIRQLDYIQRKEMGYQREHILTFDLNDWSIYERIPILREELKKVPGVSQVSSSQNLPNNISSSTYINWPGKPEEINWPIYHGKADEEFVKLYEIEIIEGRNFSRDAGDDKGAVLINETAARSLGWEDPVGRELCNWHDTCKIVGIMKDFHQHSLHQEIMPLQIFFSDHERRFSVKISGEDIERTIAGIKRTKELFSNKYPFSYSFFDDEFDKAYNTEYKAGILAGWFTLVAIIIACLGLYGLAAFATERRMKEVGIRKVFGASVTHLIYLLSKDFTWPVIISFLISVPVAYYFTQQWLGNFAYHIEMGIINFLEVLVMMILVAWITVSYRTFRVSNSNPVKSLREE